jgi:hypothetical protein
MTDTVQACVDRLHGLIPLLRRISNEQLPLVAEEFDRALAALIHACYYVGYTLHAQDNELLKGLLELVNRLPDDTDEEPDEHP